MNKGQLERIMGKLLAITNIIEEDTQGAEEIKNKLKLLQGSVAQQLKNTVWKEYVDGQAAKEAQT